MTKALAKKMEPEVEVVEGEIVIDDLDVQYQLPLSEQKKLITVTEPGASDDMFALTVKLAQSARVPLWGVNLIKTKLGWRPYINADGIKFSLARDVRGVKSDTTEVLRYPEGLGTLVVVKGRIEMMNGQEFTAMGAVKVDNNWNDANALLKAETKATRRAGYKAIASRIGMPMYDEDMKEDVAAGTYKITTPIVTPTTLGQFLSWYSKQGFTDEQVEAAAGKPIGDLEQKDLAELVQKLGESKEKETVE